MDAGKLKSEIISTAKLAWPVSLGQLGHIMLGVVDSMMVGRVGVDALAAASLVNGLFFLIIVIGFGMSMATTPLVSFHLGRKNYKKCAGVLNQSLILNSVFAILLTVIVYSASYLIRYFNQPEMVVKYAQSYMQILSYSIFPFLIFQVYKQFAEGIKQTKLPMYIAIVANIVNFFGNWILIYGKLGLPALGLDGAGYSTLLTRVFMGIAMIILVYRSKSTEIFNLNFNLGRIDFSIIRKLLRIGFPSGFIYTLEIGVFTFAAVMVGWIGSNELAAHQIAINLASISYMIILGVSAAGTIRVGYALGKNDKAGIKSAGYSAVLLGMIFMLISATVFVIFNTLLPSLYISDKEVIDISSYLLIIAALFQISDGIQAISIGILRGIMDVKIPMYFTIIAYWLIAAPTSYVLGFKFHFGIYGIWAGLLIGLSIAAVLLIRRFENKTKVNTSQI